MATYCEKCGGPLSEETGTCPSCAAAQAGEAALFTKITAETESWKDTEPKKAKKLFQAKLWGDRRTVLTYAAVAVSVLAVLVLFLLLQPSARVVRAIRGGEYEKAREIYWNTALADVRIRRIDKAILASANKLCAQFAAHEIDADSAASRLQLLGGFGDGSAEMLEDTYALFRSYVASHEAMLAAEALYAESDFLGAREQYILVVEADADYESAQTKAEECLVRFGEATAAEALALMEADDYPAALELLEEGNDALSEQNTFSEAIDTARENCLGAYVRYTLTRANELAQKEDYEAAVSAVAECIKSLGDQNEELNSAGEKYAQLLADKQVADAGKQADELYEGEKYAEAFAALEEVRAENERSEPGADKLIKAMEKRFSEDVCAKAKEAFSDDREKLADAIKLVDDALAVRELESLQTYRKELAQYLPLSLVTAEYTAKEGAVFRSEGNFEALDGKKFANGWIWGANGAELTFRPDGAYDVLECVFSTRRKDKANVSGSFEVWADGRKIYTAEKLYHLQKQSRSISVDISGCKELKLVFRCDYTVSTAENGYCYHGICDPVLIKNLK